MYEARACARVRALAHARARERARVFSTRTSLWYGEAAVSRLLKIIGLF